jgi:ribonuclease HI
MFTGGNSILKYINNMKEEEEGAPLIQKTIQYDIFTDGSEIKEKGTHKTLGLGWAYVVKQNKETIAEVSGTMSEGNNQRVELYAIFKALEYLIKISLNSTIRYDIIIHSDSDYSIKSLTLWSLNWVRNQWMT